MKNISKFNETYLNKGIHKYINQLIRTKIVGNNGDLTKRAEKRLSKIYPDSKIILTHSCTAALEICALLLNIKKGDEVIVHLLLLVQPQMLLLCEELK